MKKQWFACKIEWNTDGRSFVNSDESKSLPPLSNKEWLSDSLLVIKKGKALEKLSKTYKKYKFFGANHSFLERFARIMSKSLVFESDLLESWAKRTKRAICSQSLLCKEQQEWCSRSLLKSDGSNYLMVALFIRDTRANRSQSLFKMCDFDQKSKKRKSEGAKSERVNSQPWHFDIDQFTVVKNHS